MMRSVTLNKSFVVFKQFATSNIFTDSGAIQMYKRHFVIPLAFAILFITGCASTSEPITKNYTGSRANILDTWGEVTGSKAELFVVEEVDGQSVTNAIHATRRASSGRGFSIVVEGYSRDVPARPMKIKLLATHITGAPIHDIASRIAGTFFSVSGEVDFTPAPNRRYFVNGVLSKDGSSVWIEDSETKKPVTAVVSNKDRK